MCVCASAAPGCAGLWCAKYANSIYGTRVRTICESRVQKVNMFTSCLCCDAVVDTVIVVKSMLVRFWRIVLFAVSLLAEASGVAQHERDLFYHVHKLPKIILHLLRRTLNTYSFVVAVIWFSVLFPLLPFFFQSFVPVVECGAVLGPRLTLHSAQAHSKRAQLTSEYSSK